MTIIALDSLVGADFTAKAAAAPASSLLALGPSVYALHDFTHLNYYTKNSKVGGYSEVAHNAGLIGSGTSFTTLKLDPNSMNSTLAAEVKNIMDYAAAGHTGATTNGLSLLLLDAPNVVVQDLTVLGTDQGSLYNGLTVRGSTNPLLQRVIVEGIPGHDHVNPGETFGISLNHVTNLTMTDVQVNGLNNGGSGIGINSSSGGLFTRVQSRNNAYSLGFAFWQHTGGARLIDCAASGNHGSVNFERCTGTYELDGFQFGAASDADIAGGNDQSADMHIVVKDPLDQWGNPLARKLKVRFYTKEIGSPSKIGKKNLTVLVKGVDQTASLVNWLSVGSAS